MSQTVSVAMCTSVFELLTMLCADSATSAEGLGGTGKVGADHKQC